MGALITPSTSCSRVCNAAALAASAPIGRTRGQRLHKLVVKRRRLRAERLKTLTVAENNAAMAADTSSSAAASTPVVGAAAAALAALSVEPNWPHPLPPRSLTPGRRQHTTSHTPAT